MPKEESRQVRALAFRDALTSEPSKAQRLLQRDPALVDLAVYGSSESAVHFFAVENHLEVVRWLLSHGANPDGVSKHASPLVEASQLGHVAVCRSLLDAGADPNRTDSTGETALHKASAGGHTLIIRDLLSYGADPSIPEMCGELPIDQALSRKQDEVRAAFQSDPTPTLEQA